MDQTDTTNPVNPAPAVDPNVPAAPTVGDAPAPLNTPVVPPAVEMPVVEQPTAEVPPAAETPAQ